MKLIIFEWITRAAAITWILYFFDWKLLVALILFGTLMNLENRKK